MPRPAVFLDRDGVLIKDMGLITRCEDVTLLPGAANSLQALSAAGFAVIVVTNQTVIARGMATEADVERIHAHLQDVLGRFQAGIDAFYVCPHHPRATLKAYRVDCDCRKPRPGLLLKAALEQDIDLRYSYMVGDRGSDIAAGFRAGCSTIQVRSGEHAAAPIESSERLTRAISPDYWCSDLAEAAHLILDLTQ